MWGASAGAWICALGKGGSLTTALHPPTLLGGAVSAFSSEPGCSHGCPQPGGRQEVCVPSPHARRRGLSPMPI